MHVANRDNRWQVQKIADINYDYDVRSLWLFVCQKSVRILSIQEVISSRMFYVRYFET